MENAWSYVVRKVYEKVKQNNSFKDLEDNIYTAQDSIDTDYLKQLVVSVTDRMDQCLTLKGGPTNY